MSKASKDESVGEMFAGIFDLAIILVTIVLLGGGIYFIYLGVSATFLPLNQSTTTDFSGISGLMLANAGGSYAMVGTALWVGALVLIVFRGFRKQHQNQDDLYWQQEKRIRIEEQQANYLKFIAEQAWEQSTKVESL